MTTATDQPVPATDVVRRARRLPASVRTAQILQAALRVFSEKGFPATRVDDIAESAGLSKGGIYTHFKSKEEIFEALLTLMLTPAQPSALVKGNVTVDWIVEQVVDPMYARLSDPDHMATVRLLVSDSVRMPQGVQRWREMAIDPHIATVEELVRRGVRQGSLRKGVLAKAPWLVVAPGVYALLMQIIFADMSPRAAKEYRRAHVAMLRELLE